MNKLVFLDTETTGNTPEDFLCQLAYKTEEEIFCELYLPPVPIPPEASAVTHITNKMVKDKPVFKESSSYEKVKNLLESDESILIAHNAKFDVNMIEKENINPKKVICTLRVARYLDSSNKIPKYNLQYLRYFLDIEVEAQAHDALGDVLVLEKLFERLFSKVLQETENEVQALEKMIDISSRPSLMNTFNFGKHNGKTLEEVSKSDRDYLNWLLTQKEENNPDDEDWIYTLKYYLNKLI
jgi:DNA polymerase III epsilon subunit-like protein